MKSVTIANLASRLILDPCSHVRLLSCEAYGLEDLLLLLSTVKSSTGLKMQGKHFSLV